MIVAIHQPQYLPWCGYFDKMDKADVFCYLDNVQFKKNEWQNRNRIKTAQGWQWLTVPVLYKFPEKIQEVTINNNANWRHKHLLSLVANYSRSPFFSDYIGIFKDVYAVEWELLAKLNIQLVEELRKLLKIETKTVVASEMELSEDPTERLIDVCLNVGADTYFSGPGGADYMDMGKFAKQGIKVQFQRFVSPRYPQNFGDFEMNLSVVDLLFNCGPDSLRQIRGETCRK